MPLAPFRRGVFLAWGFAKGFTGGRHSINEAAVRLAAKGYEWVALEIDDPTLVDTDDPSSGTIGQFNLAIFDDFVTIFHAHGMLAGAWSTEGGNIYLAPGNADLAIAEIEGPGDYEGVANVIAGVGGGPLPKCSKAVVTNFSTMTRDQARVLINAEFSCLPEAYMNENPLHTPDRMDFTARNLGWPTSQPVAGVYPVNGQVPSYAQWDTEWPLADYLGEYLI